MVNELAALCELMLVEEFEDYASVYCFIQVNRDSILQQAATVADEFVLIHNIIVNWTYQNTPWWASNTECWGFKT